MLLSKVMLFIAFSVFLSSCIGLKSTIEIPKETTKNTETEIAYKEIKPFEPASVWAKRAERKNLQFIYLTIKNNSDKPIRLDKNTLEFFANLQPVKAYSLRKCYLKLNNTPIPGILLGIAGSLIAQEKTTMQNEDGSSYGVTYEYKFNAGAGLVYAAIRQKHFARRNNKRYNGNKSKQRRRTAYSI